MIPEDPRPHYTQPVRSLSQADCEPLVRLALAEDTPDGDPTSEAVFPESERRSARIVARESGVLCGLPVVDSLCAVYAETTGTEAPKIQPHRNDGETFDRGDALLELSGTLRAILRLERPMLNFLQYLSGISTSTAAAVSRAGADIAVLDTRKTLPGYRRLAKYAVYCGGGTNHRIHLSDMAMIKDNHVAAAGSVSAAIRRIREHKPGLPLDVEVDRLEQLKEALELEPEVVLLDNMNAQQVGEAVKLVQQATARGKRAPFIEVSGGWKPEQLSELHGLGKLGVSMGYLTHTTRFLDLSLEMDE